MAKQTAPQKAEPAPKPDTASCETCRFWFRRGEDLGATIGECRRYPPAGGIERPTAFGPLMLSVLTRSSGFCGEFKTK